MLVLIIFAIVIVIILWAYRCKSKKVSVSPKDIMTAVNRMATQSSSKGFYWENFKIRKPQQAKEIEQLSNRDMSRLDDNAAFQLVTTLIRWSENANIPIGQLKEYFLKEVDNLYQSGGSYDLFISKLKEEKITEAQKFGVSPDYTVCNFMIEFIEEDRQRRLSQGLSNHISKKIGINVDEIDDLVNKKIDELNLAPDISKLDREENRLFALAEEGAKMLDDIAVGINHRLHLSNAGFAEARILCSTIVINLHSNFKNEIDMDEQTDRYFLLLADATICDSDYQSDTIGFINSRIAFYKEQINAVKELNALQIFQPNNALAKIFNVLYLHPECENPNNLVPGEVSPNELVMFKTQFEKIMRHLQARRNKICNSLNESDGNNLQLEIENFLMRLLPESKRADMTQDIVYVLTDVILEQLKAGTLDSAIANVLPEHLRGMFTQLSTHVYEYSLCHDDIDSIIEEAQTNIVNKFNNL